MPFLAPYHLGVPHGAGREPDPGDPCAGGGQGVLFHPVSPRHPLLEASWFDGPLEEYLESVGDLRRAFRNQDSGCVSYGVECRGEAWFVKAARDAKGRAALARAEAFHREVAHPAIVPMRGAIECAEGRALVFPWVEGECLYHPAEQGTGEVARERPGGPYSKLRELDDEVVLAAFGDVLAAHLVVEARGFVAVDLYDGCFLVDFDAGRLRLIDLDEYRPGPFVLEEDRLPGSRRFMAPEEFRRGATIDHRTTVFGLGRSARALLTRADGSWRVPPPLQEVARRATSEDPADRYPSVAALAEAWEQVRDLAEE